jgi:hypothetical protein
MKLYISFFLLLFSCFLVQAQAPPVPPPPALPIGVEEETKEQLKIWNNGTQLKIDATAINEQFSVSIYNLNGQLLNQEKFNNAIVVSMDIATLAQGIIIVQMTTENKIYNRKLFLK